MDRVPADRRYREKAARQWDQSESRNDISWYSRNPSLLAAAANIPFPYRPGMNVPWATYVGSGSDDWLYNIPGIMALEWLPTVGRSNTATDPASVVGKEIFAKVREKFSGSIDADAPDFVIYIMALSSVYSYIAYLKRVYRILNAYSAQNHYIPDTLLMAMGFTNTSITALKENRMQLFQSINELVHMTRKFHLPAAFDIINRHYWLNDNVYMDADSINSQFYVFYSQFWYQYSLRQTPQNTDAGGLAWVQLAPAGATVEYLFQFGRQLIDALAGSDDAYIISGYLMRAYEDTPQFIVEELPLGDPLIPRYDPEVLSQIENALPLVTPPGVSYTVKGNVSQDPTTNAIICNPQAVGNPAGLLKSVANWKREQYLSIRSDSPSAADVVIATRLKMGFENEVITDTQHTYDIICGSEILRSVNMYCYVLDESDSSLRLVTRPITGANQVQLNSLGNTDVETVCLMQSFDWHPIVPYFTGIGALLAGDVHNLTVLTNEQLKQINRICLYSEFNSYGQI